MEDYFDDFEDDFDEDEFMDDEQFEKRPEDDTEMAEQSSDGSDIVEEPEEAESHDDDSKIKDAFFIGGAMGFAYEEGRRNGKRKKR